MPQNAPIVIKDGAATPVDRTYNPRGAVNSNANEYVFLESAVAGGPDAQPRISIEKRPYNTAAPTTKDRIVLRIPRTVTRTEGGVSTVEVQHVDMVAVEVVCAKDADAATRKNIRVQAANLLLSAFVTSVVDAGEAIW
jgi:hypothetical protein